MITDYLLPIGLFYVCGKNAAKGDAMFYVGQTIYLEGKQPVKLPSDLVYHIWHVPYRSNSCIFLQRKLNYLLAYITNTKRMRDTMKAEILSWRDKKGAKKFTTCEGVQFGCHIYETANYRRSPSKAHQSIQMEGRYFGIMAFVVGKIKMVR